MKPSKNTTRPPRAARTGAYRSLWALAALAAIIVFGGACASAPPAPAPEPTPEPAPVVEPTPSPEPAPAGPSLAEVEAVEAEALARRNKAFDLGLKDRLPADYAAAETSFLDGRAAKAKPELASAKLSFEKARDAFAALIERGYALLLPEARERAAKAEQRALAAGAEAVAPERLSAAGRARLAAEADLAAAKPDEALAGYERARLLFELGEKRATASGLRERIRERGFAAWDPGNFQSAENKFEAEPGLVAAAGDPPRRAELGQAVDALDEALLRYRLVIEKGREASAQSKKTASAEAKTRAEGIKAAIAVKEAFAAALARHQEGLKAFEERRFEDSETAFQESAAAFEAAYVEAAEKRARAEAAMKAAAGAAAESERKAQEAEPVLATKEEE